MLKREGGLAFTAHPRVKGSRYFPDDYAAEDFFQDDDVFMGAEWKAVPSDLSEPRLGRRALKLLDEMCQWGYKKKLVGAGDMFYLNMDSELYSQMNINYLKLPNIPTLDDGDWSEVLDVLRRGDFFVSTGEVLLHDHTISQTQVSVDVEWTFPLGFAEIIWGEGAADKNAYDWAVREQGVWSGNYEFPHRPESCELGPFRDLGHCPQWCIHSANLAASTRPARPFY